MSIKSSVSKSIKVRYFHSSLPTLVKVGDKIPSVPVSYQSPGNSIDLSQQLKSGKSIIVGVPGAFSPGCSQSHVPGYLKNWKAFNEKGYNQLYVVSVNDAFVMDAWAKQLQNDSDEVKFVADAKGEFAKALDVAFDASKVFGNERSKRYALLVDNGKVTHTFIEPENTAIDVSEATKVLEIA